MKLRLETEIVSIRNQLNRAMNEARRTGRFADGSWWVKSNHALRVKGRQCQQIQNALHDRRQSARQGLESKFVTIARQELSEEVFQRILEKAKA
jgi:hypothetical protein